jgi:hypothetical protein
MSRWGAWLRTILFLIILVPVALPVRAATAFGDPAFQAQWQRGEALTPNFWGPLSTARDGQREPYVEGSLDFSEGGPANPGQGMRLVQYFDKARMELTHPASGIVTNGLLATELVTGKLQLGDNTFQPMPPPAIPVAGDPDNAGPTYAQLATTAKPLFDAGPDHTGAYTQAAVSASGTISVSDAARTDAASF